MGGHRGGTVKDSIIKCHNSLSLVLVSASLLMGFHSLPHMVVVAVCGGISLLFRHLPGPRFTLLRPAVGFASK